MNLKEIVTRDKRIPVIEDECLFVIKEYIKERKGIDVNPVINLDTSLMLQYQIMNRLFLCASNWYLENKYKE